MRYLMLILFPPVGIVMYLKDEFGPPKKIRYAVCALSLLWMFFVIYMFAKIPIKNNQEKAQLESEIFEDPMAGKTENKTENMKKAEFDSLSDREKAEKVKSFLADAVGDYAEILFEDGTGIQFPGAEMPDGEDSKAWYGKIDNNGDLTSTLGEVTIQNGVYVCKEYSKQDLLSVDVENKLPTKYKSDATSIAVRKTGNGYYLAFVTVYDDPQETDYDAIIKVAKECGINSGQVTFVDEFSEVVGRKSWPENSKTSSKAKSENSQ